VKHLIAALCLLSIACGGTGPTDPSPSPQPTPKPDLGRPNIVLIFADDMGFGDTSMNGGSIQTPNIDRIASEGTRFTDFYVPAALCSPSRAALMTGRYPVHVGVPWNPARAPNADEIMVSELLHEVGYSTAILGKWHLGWEPHEMPIHRGFDYFWGMTHGNDDSPYILGDQPTDDGVAAQDIPRRLVDYSLRFIQEHPAPFFIYIAHRDPHLPNYGTYVQAMQRMDASVGQLLDGLETLGVAENTLVFFTSDNGPARNGGSPGIYSGGKGSVEEGGIRMPAAARWPARIPPGTTVTDMASTIDLLPTFVALAGGTLPADRPYPGADITPLLQASQAALPGRGQAGARELLLWQQGGALGALRSGQYKWLRPGLWNSQPTLINLRDDPTESKDLKFQYPELAAELEARMVQLAKEAQ